MEVGVAGDGIVLGVDFSSGVVWVAQVAEDAAGDAAFPPKVAPYEVARPERREDGVAAKWSTARVAWETGRAVERARVAAEAHGRVVALAVEQPVSRVAARVAVLMPLYGAIVAKTPAGAVPLGVKASEWRSHHGLRTLPPKGAIEAASKTRMAAERKVWLKRQSCSAAVGEASRLGCQDYTLEMVASDDNAAEALLIALAGRVLMRGHSAVSR